jgi:hypothetical protein
MMLYTYGSDTQRSMKDTVRLTEYNSIMDNIMLIEMMNKSSITVPFLFSCQGIVGLLLIFFVFWSFLIFFEK